MSTYLHHMGGALESAATAKPVWLPHVRAAIPPHKHKCLMRWRLKVWPLRANTDTGTPRPLRVCRFCSCGLIEDEKHVLLECPAYTALREKYGLTSGAVPLAQRPMRDVMMKFDQVKLASLLYDILQRRNEALRLGETVSP